MDKNEVLKILETAKDENGEVPMRLVRQAFEKLPEHCEDTISRRAAIDELYKMLHDCFWADDEELDAVITTLNDLPSVQPEPEIHWGYTPTYERPLGDVEIVPRLRDIQKQIPGGSYAIDRAIEIIEAVASAQPEPDIIACGDCKHWICHDKRCGYWNHGVKPLDWCCHWERRTDE